MKIENSFTKLIGNTPLIKLENASKITKCNILGKAEFLNPGQSVKDRAALYILNDAIKNGFYENYKFHTTKLENEICKKIFSYFKIS